jgi:hypothetical protein
MQIRETLQDSPVDRGRGYAREALTTATLAGFEYWRAMLFRGLTVEHFPFSTTTTAGAQDPLSVASVTFGRDDLSHLLPLLPV